jgi:hypothetical protein
VARIFAIRRSEFAMFIWQDVLVIKYDSFVRAPNTHPLGSRNADAWQLWIDTGKRQGC